MYTGDELFDMWIRPFRQQLSQLCTHAVSTFDAAENVPKEKAQTQLARIIAGNKSKSKKEKESGSKAIRYDEHMEFHDDGIYDPKQANSVQRFDLRAVQSGPRGLRKHLWNYIFSKLKSTPMPDGRTLYYETDSTSAWKFEGDKEFQRDLTTSHAHGESDPSQAFWLEYLCFHQQEGKTAVIRSKDGDCVPILLHAIELQQRHAPKEWERKPVYWMSKRDEIYEMREYLAFVKRKYRMSESQYMIFCILCGTDFYRKKLICNGFGVPKIFAAMEQIKRRSTYGTRPCQSTRHSTIEISEKSAASLRSSGSCIKPASPAQEPVRALCLLFNQRQPLHLLLLLQVTVTSQGCSATTRCSECLTRRL